jgi:hypothetical protein
MQITVPTLLNVKGGLLPKHQKYTDKNLIKYEDTIQLHFDQTGGHAWLTLKNYGGIFDKKPVDVVTETTIGKPVKPEFSQTISIGEMLDVINVIHFQVYVVSTVTERRIFDRRSLCQLIEDGLKHGPLGITIPPSTDGRGPLGYKDNDPRFWFNTYQHLSVRLNQRMWLVPEATRFMDRITISYAIKKYKEFGFTAYFPKPSLVLQEERTELVDRGKTSNLDSRFIEPILSNMPQPPEFAFPEFFREMDEDHIRRRYPENTPLLLAEKKKTGEAGYLHCQIPRLCCFAFRGEARDPRRIKDGFGFLPGFTRTDESAYSANTNFPDKPLPWTGFLGGKTVNVGEVAVRFDERRKNKNDPRDYKAALKEYAVFELGVYLVDQTFKGYVSLTKSTAMAKRFANYYSPKVDCAVYCYAARCRGGFVAPSSIQGVPERAIDFYLRKQHVFGYYAEQEIAMPGQVGWHDVVGFRVIRCDESGQYFSGPIFLQDWLRKEHHDRVKRSQGDRVGGTVSGSRFVEVSPQSGAIAPNGTLQFKATVQGARDPQVIWSVDGIVGGKSTVGTISKSGLYTAPATKDWYPNDPETDPRPVGHWYTVTATTFATQENWRFHPNSQVKDAPDRVKEFPAEEAERFYSANAAVNVTNSPPKQRGQTKPVQPWLPKPDNDAFNALFELLSGKSQGESSWVDPDGKTHGIFKSYPVPPFGS